MSTYKFQVVRGSHRVGTQYSDERLPNGARKVIRRGYNVPTGGYVETNVDLAKKYPSQPPKFVRVDRMAEEEQQVELDLRSMTKAQLLRYADENEIDVSDCQTKDAIVERLRSMIEA